MMRCSMDGCGHPHLAKGLCGRHYQRFKKHGDASKTAFVKAEKGEPMRWIIEHSHFRGDDCLIWPFAKDRASGQTYINGEFAHRVMCELANGPAPSSKHEAAHNCGNGKGSCVHPGHLRWATRKENEADKLIHGTLVTGENHHATTLRQSEVIEIRQSKGAVTGRALSRKFGVSPATISRIQNGQTWKFLEGCR